MTILKSVINYLVGFISLSNFPIYHAKCHVGLESSLVVRYQIIELRIIGLFDEG